MTTTAEAKADPKESGASIEADLHARVTGLLDAGTDPKLIRRALDRLAADIPGLAEDLGSAPALKDPLLTEIAQSTRLVVIQPSKDQLEGAAMVCGVVVSPGERGIISVKDAKSDLPDIVSGEAARGRSPALESLQKSITRERMGTVQPGEAILVETHLYSGGKTTQEMLAVSAKNGDGRNVQVMMYLPAGMAEDIAHSIRAGRITVGDVMTAAVGKLGVEDLKLGECALRRHAGCALMVYDRDQRVLHEPTFPEMLNPA